MSMLLLNIEHTVYLREGLAVMHGSTQANMKSMALVLFGPVILGDTKLHVVGLGEESPTVCSEYIPLHRRSEENVWWWLICSWTQRQTCT